MWGAKFLLLSLLPLLGPFGDYSNFAVDLEGRADTRERTWGTADSFTQRIQFYPPEGYRVRILHLDGDLTAWPRFPIHPSLLTGVLVSFQTTAPDGSTRCFPCASNTLLYRQNDLKGGGRSRLDFSEEIGFPLERDNILRVVVASWLNDTGGPIHLEPTWRMKYVFEPLP